MDNKCLQESHLPNQATVALSHNPSLIQYPGFPN